MTLINFPTADILQLKRLDEINWDPNLGKPHGLTENNGVREPETWMDDLHRPGAVWTKLSYKDGKIEETTETNDLARYKDKINPAHYKKGDTEVIQLTRHLGFREGNIVKYAARHKEKGRKEDILKIIWYAQDILKTDYPDSPSTDAYGYHGC